MHIAGLSIAAMLLTASPEKTVVRVQTTMVSANGEEDREPMRFSLVRSGERWIITRLS